MLTAERRKAERLEQNDQECAGDGGETKAVAAECLCEDGVGSLGPTGQKEPWEAWAGKSLHKNGIFS